VSSATQGMLTITRRVVIQSHRLWWASHICL